MRVHGGRAPVGVIDFSAPRNPLGPPRILEELVKECTARKVYEKYPDHEYIELRHVIAEFYNASPEDVVIYNGSAEALSLLPLALRARTIVVIEPTFGDHGLLAEATRIQLERILAMIEKGRLVVDADQVVKKVARVVKPAIVLLSRPNNPTGYAVPRSLVEELASMLPPETMLLVDEAFADLCNCEALDYSESWIELRSLTKTFAAPGLRLGFTVTLDKRVNNVLDSVRQPWPVDAITDCVYRSLLGDYASVARDYIRRARDYTVREREWLATRLQRLGLEVHDSHAPFILVKHECMTHPSLQEKLVSRGVYVRDASSFYGLGPEYSRVSVRSRSDNERLVEAFREVMKDCVAF